MNSTIKPSACKTCGNLYHSAMYHKPRKPISPISTKKRTDEAYTAKRTVIKRSKRPKQIGKGALKYNEWRDTVAKPYLDTVYGHVCTIIGCSRIEGLHVDHIKNRGSHPELKMTLANVQYLCFEHHRAKTDNVKETV